MRYFFDGQLNKLLFEELTVDNGKWTVNVSTAWILLKSNTEGDTSTVHCETSNFNLRLSNSGSRDDQSNPNTTKPFLELLTDAQRREGFSGEGGFERGEKRNEQ